ncbi:PAK1IP1 [Blepharisma stoltei]|uniref:Uncharacterized protein n=1 Tax=Blepharisma stoltei TaxID=1481888 RepID=A0AAU9JBN5_9CILI|nr:unnamed protein product [Blepharisma stoltei]
MSEILIVVGTYTGGLIGLQGPVNHPKTIFAFSATTNCIKSLNIQGEFLFAGGYDEMIRIFHLNERKELGAVLENSGSVNSIASCKSHFLTGNDQGKVCIWRMKDFTMLHSLKGHRSSVNGLSLHPSSRMALSVGKDNRLYLWNLIKARISFRQRYYFPLEEVHWSPCGYFFAIRSYRNVYYFNSETNIKEDYITLTHTSQLNTCGFLGKSDLIAAGDNNGEIVIWKINGGSLSFKAHSIRITKLQYTEIETSNGKRGVLISLTTQGEVSIWNVTPIQDAIESLTPGQNMKVDNNEDLLITSINLNCRCSSLAVK